MKKKLSLSALGLIAVLSLSACTGGASPDTTSEPTITGPVVTSEGRLAAEALQKFFVDLDNEADTATAVSNYDGIKSGHSASSVVVASDIPPEHAVNLYKEYTKNFKQTPAGNEITVVPDGLTPDETGKVTIKSSAIRISFNGKPRAVDVKGKDTFVLKNDNGTWKIADAIIG